MITNILMNLASYKWSGLTGYIATEKIIWGFIWTGIQHIAPIIPPIGIFLLVRWAFAPIREPEKSEDEKLRDSYNTKLFVMAFVDTLLVIGYLPFVFHKSSLVYIVTLISILAVLMMSARYAMAVHLYFNDGYKEALNQEKIKKELKIEKELNKIRNGRMMLHTKTLKFKKTE